MLFPVSGYQSVCPIFNWCYSGKFVCKGKCAVVLTWWTKGLEILIKVKIANTVQSSLSLKSIKSDMFITVNVFLNLALSYDLSVV